MIMHYGEDEIKSLVKYLKSFNGVQKLGDETFSHSQCTSVIEDYYVVGKELNVHIEKRAIAGGDYKYRKIEMSSRDETNLLARISEFEHEIFFKPAKEKSFIDKYLPFLSDSDDGEEKEEI